MTNYVSSLPITKTKYIEFQSLVIVLNNPLIHYHNSISTAGRHKRGDVCPPWLDLLVRIGFWRGDCCHTLVQALMVAWFQILLHNYLNRGKFSKITDQWTRTKVSSPPALLFLSSEKLAKSSQPTSESSRIQTTELIVKCHTILEMGSHDLVSNFGKGPKGGFKKIFLDLFSAMGGSNWLN